MKLKPFALVLLAMAFALSAAAQRMFIKVVDGSQIPGEVVLQGYENWSEITAFNGGSSAEPMPIGSGTGAGIPQTKCFTISMVQDKMAYRLKAAMYLGRVLTNVQFDFVVTTPNSTTAVFYRVYMEDVLVTLVEEAINEGDGRPFMNVSFVPKRFRYTYWPRLANGNMSNTPVIFGWNTVANQAWN